MSPSTFIFVLCFVLCCVESRDLSSRVLNVGMKFHLQLTEDGQTDIVSPIDAVHNLTLSLRTCTVSMKCTLRTYHTYVRAGSEYVRTLRMVQG